MTNRQLMIVIAAVTVLSLSLAWLIERRTILGFRAELDAWGMPRPWSERSFSETLREPPSE